ncbi:MAG: AAA family ATPase [Paraglaciecola sp.]|nr:AAA family ATPase [Paraglaciecola sp.]
MKKFYNRTEQISAFRDTSNNIGNTTAKLSVVVGRRRVGKTRLIKEAFNHCKHLYFFVSRKSERALVDEFKDIIVTELNAKFFSPNSLKDILEFLLDYAKNNPITIIFDEFQDIEKINTGFYSELQNLWDQYKQDSKMHLVVCGSIYNLMSGIFKGKDEPLFNRDDYYYHIKPLTPSYIKQVMEDEGRFDDESYLQWWCLSGGIPKYIEWIASTNKNKDTIEQLITSSSPLIKEGIHRLVEDFGDEHRTYFDILGAIASGHNTKPKVENYLGYQINDAFPKLVESFEIINRVRSMDAKETSKTYRYEIADPFLRFWFRFIYKNRSAVEMGNYPYIKDIIRRDYKTYSGFEFEQLIKEILRESMQFNKIGSFWDRKGENEIDIVAINDPQKKIVSIEAKRQKKNYNEQALLMKVTYALSKLKLQGYSVEHKCVALDELPVFLDEYQPQTL